MALPVNGSTHLIPALLLTYRPRKDERLSWPSWSLVVTHQLQVERRTRKDCQSETDVLPLCYVTNKGKIRIVTVKIRDWRKVIKVRFSVRSYGQDYGDGYNLGLW